MPSLLRRSFAEFLGTFMLVAVGPGAAMVAARTNAFGPLGVALAFGLIVTVIVGSLGDVSGAHVNPAVTFGLWSVRRFPLAEVPVYVLAQCAGAVTAAALCGWLFGPIVSVGATTPSVSLARAFVIETGYSAVLGLVIMSVSSESRALIAPFLIGITVFAGALVTGPVTGGSFNPARSFGPAVVSGTWTAHWLYWLAPTLGMTLAMQLSEWLRSRATETPSVDLRDLRDLRGNIRGMSP